jgi:ParB/RepB/Spo0J family partition protein
VARAGDAVTKKAKKITRPEIASIVIASINLHANPLRPLNGEEVKRLAASMQRIGLMTPITVRYHNDVPSDDGTCDDSFELIAGRHRVAAARLLGWERIDGIEIECSDVDAKLWEIAENLHRAELTKLQHDEQVAEWIRLTDSNAAQLAPHKKGQQPGGINAAARELGVERTDAQRAVKVDSLSPEAKAAAVKYELDDNRSALLDAAKETDPKAQVARIVERVAKPKAKPALRNAGLSDAVSDDEEIEAPEVIEENILHGIGRMIANARMFKRLLKLSALDREAAERISSEINQLIQRCRSILSILEKKSAKSIGNSAVKSAADRAEARSQPPP